MMLLLLFFKVTLVVQSHIVSLVYSTRSYRLVFYSETLCFVFRFFWNTFGPSNWLQRARLVLQSENTEC